MDSASPNETVEIIGPFTRCDITYAGHSIPHMYAVPVQGAAGWYNLIVDGLSVRATQEDMAQWVPLLVRAMACGAREPSLAAWDACRTGIIAEGATN